MIRQLVPLVFFCLLAGLSRADEVGRFSNDWTGNGIVVEAVADPRSAASLVILCISTAA